MQHTIALDLDDVLARFFPAMCERFNQPCKRINIWNGEGEAKFLATNFHIIEKNKRFWLNLDKLSYPNDITFKVDYYITASPGFIKDARKQWLTTHGFPEAPLISASDKVAEMRRLGVDTLIDDNPTTLELVKEAGFIPIQFVPYYMSDIRPHLNPIVHLSQVPEILKTL